MIGAFYLDGSTDFAPGNAATAFTAPGIALGDAMTAGGASLTQPSTTYSAYDYGFFGPSFEIGSNAPEPASVLLVVVGAGGLAAINRKRRGPSRSALI
jgi:hypothetical protein